MTDQPNDRWADLRVVTDAALCWQFGAPLWECAYLNGSGTCSFGCTTEPACQTDGPWTDEHKAQWEQAQRWHDQMEPVLNLLAERDELEAERDALRSLLNLDLLTRASTACRNAQRQMVGQVRWFDWVPAHLDRIAAALRVPQEENHGK